MIKQTPSRRTFLSSAGLLPVSLALGSPLRTTQAQAAPSSEGILRPVISKTLKIGMVKEGKTLTEKFALAKEAGFDGIELSAPGFSVAEVLAAKSETGFVVDGSVCAGHWEVRHSDPDASVRAEALKTLLAALQSTHDVGGHSVLLVVGHGKDGTEAEVWERSVANIRQAIPLAGKLGVSIVVENVWNEFCYDHKGGADQSAEKFVRYIDEFNSPWVGMQFDIGNHWKYGPTGDWIRQLGKRVMKLDIKGYSRRDDKFTPIHEGDIDYADVKQALAEIGFCGWCAAEVAGGGLTELREIVDGMQQALG